MSLSKIARRAMLGTRGSASDRASIWQLKSPTSAMTSLVGDLRMQLFFYCEGDPDLLAADYSPSPIINPLMEAEVLPDVLATLRSGLEQYIFLDDGSARSDRVKCMVGNCDLRFRHVGVGELESNWIRIKNWQALVAICNRSSGWNLNPQRHAIIDLLADREEIAVESIVRRLDRHSPALVLGGLAQLLRERSISADLDHGFWTWSTPITGGAA